MARINRNNIDRKTNKPNPKNTEGLDKIEYMIEKKLHVVMMMLYEHHKEHYMI